MHMPLVSIITPAYNAEEFIRDTLESVMIQSYPHIEHIVIDDGSTDSTSSILKMYEKKYNLKWLSKSNEGQVPTLNKCIDIAQGEIIIWLNADDVLFYISTVNDIVDYFKNNSDIDVIYGHMAIINNVNRLLKILYAPPQLTYNHLIASHYAACICYRVGTLREFKFDSAWDFVMDYEQCLRMAKNGIKFGFLDRIILGYRRHGATKSLSKKRDAMIELRKVKECYGQLPLSEVKLIKFRCGLIIMESKILGIKTIFGLCFIPNKAMLAFPIKFGSFLRLTISQLLPYVYID